MKSCVAKAQSPSGIDCDLDTMPICGRDRLLLFKQGFIILLHI